MGEGTKESGRTEASGSRREKVHVLREGMGKEVSGCRNGMSGKGS